MSIKRTLLSYGLLFFLAGLVRAEPLTLPLEARPDWLARDGIVMAGSWEPLLFRVRRDGDDDYTPTPEQRAAYIREHSPAMIDRLKALGVNFVMMHCYKGGGLQAERESMADAVRFAGLCHEAGLRVGVYNYSGAFIWELFFKEMPHAKDWVVLDEAGNPRQYGGATYRYYWNRNHPDAQQFYRQLVRFAVNDMGVDLIHFDNYIVGPGTDANSVQRFRDYLRGNFSGEQLQRAGVEDVLAVQPPSTGSTNSFLLCAWQDFSCRSLADSYHDMGRYARTLRKDILVECNPGGVRDRIFPPVDQGRLLTGGEAFWDEGRMPGYRDGQLHSRIRTYKVARRMDNMAFAYSTTPLEMAEAMTFNLDCLGCICWFEYDNIVERPGAKEPVSPELAPFIRFFHARRDLLRKADVMADVAVLRSFSSQVFTDGARARLTARVEQMLIEQRVPFQIIYDCHLIDLKRYRALILAGCVALSDGQAGQIKRYVQGGGRLCMIGPVATHDEWMIPRAQPALAELPSENVIRISEKDDYLAAVRQACGEHMSLLVKAPPGLCAELTRQPGRRLVHLVNYQPDQPAREIALSVQIPGNDNVCDVILASPELTGDLKIPFTQKDGEVTFAVEAVKTYAIAIVNFESRRPGSGGG